MSGRLDRTPFGRAVPVTEDSVGQVLPANDSPRRSIYLEVRRTKPVSLLAAFDAPVMAVNCDRRQSSTSAPQSLMLMNSEFVLNHAQALARRLRSEAPGRPDLSRHDRRRVATGLQSPDLGRGAGLGRAFIAQQLDVLDEDQGQRRPGAHARSRTSVNNS